MSSLKELFKKNQVSILYVIFVFSIISIISWGMNKFVKKTIISNVESQLVNSTKSNINLIKISMFTSVKNHLKGIAEKNKQIIEKIYEKSQNGLMSEDNAKKMVNDILQSQTIGKEGYIYCINSSGIIAIHPKKNLINENVNHYEFIREQIKRKNGYIEYKWKNPGEYKKRSKVLYMVYFEPWDWILSVSAYLDEFLNIVDKKDFRHQILSIQFWQTGYAYVMDTNGNIIVHPKLEGQNMKYLPFVKEMCAKKSGKITYSWKNPDEKNKRLKLVLYGYIQELDWIVASSAYFDEFYAPISVLNSFFWSIVFISLAIILPITFYMKKKIFKPLRLVQNMSMHLIKFDLSNQFSDSQIQSSSEETQKLMCGMNTMIDEFCKLIGEVKMNGVKLLTASESIVSTLKDLSENSDLTQSKANNVAGASEQMATNFSSIVMTSEEVSTSIKRMTNSSAKLSDYINKVARQIKDISKSISTVGQHAVDGAKISDEAMMMSKNAHETINSLDDAAKEIGGVTQLIKRIADKTNLLALNASIEAASAGEAGKGFSVVAASIQKFAEQSNQAAENIAERIVNVQEKTAETIGVIDKITRIINKINESSETISASVNEQIHHTEDIVDNATHANTLSKEIVIAMDKLLSGANDISKKLAETEEGAAEITKNIQDVDQSTQKSHTNIQDIHQLASEMNQMAQEFKTLIKKFNIK